MRICLLVAIVGCGQREPARVTPAPSPSPSPSGAAAPVAAPPAAAGLTTTERVEPASDLVRQDLTRTARAARALPVCTEAMLSEAGARGPISAMADAALRKSSFDPAFLDSGWFAPPDAASRFDASSKVVIVYLADEARFPTNVDSDGIFKGRGVALAERRPLCEFSIAFKSSDDGSINYHDHFHRALARATLGPYTPEPR